MFELGDIVQIRPNIRSGQSYEDAMVNDNMATRAGTSAVITNIPNRGRGWYQLDGNPLFIWTGSMFMPKAKQPKVKLPKAQALSFSTGEKTLEQSVTEAIESIKTGYYKGTYLKLELEANLGRGDRSDYDECYDCSGEGYWDCDANHAEIMDGDTPTGEYEDSCEYCEDNTVTCSACDGRGRFDDNDQEFTDGWCENFMVEHVSEACRKATVYSGFLYDGSVDSEFNFTVPLSSEGLGFAIEYINAFKALANEVGGGMDVTGAGMHITILRSENGNYPSGNGHFDSEALASFEKNMNKLMPALFLLASEDYKSRGLSYRRPGVNIHSHSNAIAGAGSGSTGAFEWRVFETCYRRPEMLYDFICVIAKGLVFYHPKAKPVVFKTRLGKLEFYDNPRQYGVHKYFHTEKHLLALEQGLKYLLPDHRQAEEVLRLRNFKLTPESIAKRDARLASHFEGEWLEYKKTLKQNEDRFVKRRLAYEPESIHEEMIPIIRQEFRKANPNRKASYIKLKIEERLGKGYLSASLTI